MVCQRSIVNWSGVDVSSVYVHSTICETYVVQQYSIDVLSIGGGYIYPQYMCILLYVKLFSVTVFQRSISIGVWG